MKYNSKFCMFAIAALSLFSCTKESIEIIDENLIIGRWEPMQPDIILKNGEERMTPEKVCDWYDTYTFLEDGVLIYDDGIDVDSGTCATDMTYELQGTWEQNKAGEFIFFLTRTADGKEVNIKPKDLYFVQEEFLVIELYVNDPDSEISYYRYTFIKG